MKYPRSPQPIPKKATKVFEGIIFDVWQWQQQLFDGSFQTFEKASRNASVGILAITKDKKIVLTSQEQPGMKPFVSLVGGVVDDNEDVLATAHRELLEEAGMKTADLELWYSVQPVTKVEWPIYIFVARACEQVKQQNLDPGEKISLEYLSWQEFLEVIYQDKFRDKEVALRLLRLMKDQKKLQALEEFIFK